MDPTKTKDSKMMAVSPPEMKLNNVQLVPEHPESFVGGSTSFDAYPLESSSDFLSNENGVVFMPLTPTDLPLSFQNIQPRMRRSTHFSDQIAQQPICHGFFFPYSSTENAPERTFDAQSIIPQTCATASMPIQSDEQHFLTASRTAGLPNTPDNELQLLLLQKLIALQLASHLSSANPNGQEIDDSALPYNPPLEVPPTFPPDNLTAIPLTQLEQNMSTYLIPVEATLHDNRGLALHVTPRSDIPDATSSPGLKMECPTDQLVLYPYSTKQAPISNQDASPDTATFDGQQAAPAQTLTMTDIKNCIRRGSLELPLDNNDEIVNSIKGHKKPGFVLLSIRHEKVASEDKTSTQTTPLKAAAGVNFRLPDFRHSSERPSTSSVAQASRRANKRRQRLLRADTDPQRRSLRKTPRLNSKVLDDVQQPSGVSVEQAALTTISRFRVSRFADKKQVWLAPSGTGCFTVHDLWTTKLPDYVMKKIKQLEKGIEHDQADASVTEKNYFDSGAVPNTCCTMCQSTQRESSHCPFVKWMRTNWKYFLWRV
ncbi:hypothetical protein T265_00015 [Opisthorchis viverrini]|uniref:Uncharacterized protein n=2 Tax=Opisthorchis viverrini TaxID=6198 RepID=A0A075A6Z0_OPIVI|nr:hypothetical protein T265_00015 [Opisthorchis viverrini]KER34137.1 hypothetical protein T265_00015 [Opisthorchis viverrini]